MALGSASALSAIDLSDEALAEAGVDRGCFDPHVAQVDLTVWFYQYHTPSIADWFGCEWRVTAGELGVTDFFDSRPRLCDSRGAA